MPRHFERSGGIPTGFTATRDHESGRGADHVDDGDVAAELRGGAVAADVVEERADPVIASAHESAEHSISDDLAGGKIKEGGGVGGDDPRRIPSI